MKKGDKPKDLSQSWWSKNKAKTLKSTGLGKALAAYAKVRAGKPSLQYYKDCLKELNTVLKNVEKAEKACNAKLHEDTIIALKGYQPLAKAEMTAINKEETDYTKRLTIFKKSREKLVKELKVLHKKAEENIKLGKSGLVKVNQAVDKGNTAMAAKLGSAINNAADGVLKTVETAIKTCAPWRTGEAPYSQPNLDVVDRDNAGGTKTLETINPIMVELNGFKSDAERLKKDLASTLKTLV